MGETKCKLHINECACGNCLKSQCQYKGCDRCSGMAVLTHCAMFEGLDKSEEAEDYEFLYN